MALPHHRSIVRLFVALAALHLPISVAVAGEPLRLMILAARPGPEAISDGSPHSRALIEAIGAGLTTGDGGKALASRSDGPVMLLGEGDASAEALADPAASDRAILDALAKAGAAGAIPADLVLRAVLYARAVQRDAGKPEDIALELRVELSLRDVASGRPVGIPPRRKSVPLDCGNPPDAACIQSSVSAAAAALGREIGSTLAYRIAALLPPRP